MKVIFFGTPEFAVPVLEALAATDDLRPAWVISQPSRPVGRRRQLKAPPVVTTAERLGLPVKQVASVRDRDFLVELEAMAPDVAVVVAFGQIFRNRLLRLPRLGCVNLHASLLPAFRGAGPIQASLVAGNTVTGVTTMQMSRGLDSGPMLLQASLEIGADEIAPELSARLSVLGSGLIVETLRALERGEIEAQAQDEEAVTYAPMLTRADAEVDWTLDAATLYNRWRAYQPWPGLSSTLIDRPLKLVSCCRRSGTTQAAPGTILGLASAAAAADSSSGVIETMEVACGGGTILGVGRVQRPGKKPVAAVDFLNGEHLETGERFSSP